MTAGDNIQDYHVHVYFDAASRDAAHALRDAVTQRFDVGMGRWHEMLVGPHPRWSYLITFEVGLFAEFVPWLMRNRRGLVLLLHPNTGNPIPDHTEQAFWAGEVLDLDLAALG